ncbi:MAG: hypothetical protein ACOY3X_02450 [Pseudomonadota bacterium]
MLIRLISKGFLAAFLLFAGGVAQAMVSMEDDALASVQGAGLALGSADFRLLAGPTSYFEAIGQVANAPWQRGDGRYYGISISGNTPTSSWVGPCGSGINNMGCPIGGTIAQFSPFDNPFVLRVFDYTSINYQGTAGTTLPVFELLAPTNSDAFRFATWTELYVGGTSATRLQGQMLLTDSKFSNLSHQPASTTRNNNKFRIFQHTNPLDPTIGFIWENQYEGDFRFSVNQLFASPDVAGVPPFFSNNEGFYAVNIRAFVPLGQLFYQSLVLDDTPAQDGNFSFDVTRIPNTAGVYSDFYSLAVADSALAGYTRAGRGARYYQTHGFFTVGTLGTTNNNGTTGAAGTRSIDTTDGIFFVKGDASPTFSVSANRPSMCNDCSPGANQTYTFANMNQANLGDVLVEGILIQHMKITTCSAGGPSAC